MVRFLDSGKIHPGTLLYAGLARTLQSRQDGVVGRCGWLVVGRAIPGPWRSLWGILGLGGLVSLAFLGGRMLEESPDIEDCGQDGQGNHC